jgi:hypothetical protein
VIEAVARQPFDQLMERDALIPTGRFIAQVADDDHGARSKSPSR